MKKAEAGKAETRRPAERRRARRHRSREGAGLLSLPREVGNVPEDGEPILAGVGRFGPYVKHGKTYASLETATTCSPSASTARSR